MKTSILRLLTVTALCAASSVHAQTNVFLDNFDGSPYTDNAPLVTGTGNLDHGYWAVNSSGTGATIVSTSEFLSSPRSLQLDAGASGQAQPVGTFSTDGINPTYITDAYSLRFSFLRTAANLSAEFYIYGSDGLPVLLVIGDGFRAYFNDYSRLLYSGLSVDTWYTVELNLDASTGTNGTNFYSVSLFDSADILLATTNAAFYQPVDDSRWFTAYVNTASADGGLFYIDNVQAMIVPEPGTSVLLLLGGATAVLDLMRRKTRR